MGTFSVGQLRENTQAFKRCNTHAQTQADMQRKRVFPIGLSSTMEREDNEHDRASDNCVRSLESMEVRGEEKEVALRKQGGVMLS